MTSRCADAAPSYLKIVRHYERCLKEHGDNHRGVDWPNARDAETRYRVMLEVIRPSETRPVTLLDFGCGASHLYEFMQRTGVQDIIYAGLDLSPEFVALSRAKFPEITYYCLDVLDPDALDILPRFDYVVANGVFTEKIDLEFEYMISYFANTITKLFSICTKGIAFNVMSKHVDWEREDLFHVPFDLMAEVIHQHLGRNFVIRNDYGLYEYTVYAYR